MLYQHSRKVVRDNCSGDHSSQSQIARTMLAHALEALNAVSTLLCKTGQSRVDSNDHAGALTPLALLRD